MPQYTPAEQQALDAYDRLVETRKRAEAGEVSWQALGISVLRYAGDGKFGYEEDLLNMVHVTELIRESGWKPGPGFNLPPREPRR